MTDRTPPMTHATGAPVVDNTNIMMAGPRGPALAALRADCVIVGGHVMDPATGLDQLADIAVDNGRIVAVETAEAGGLRELDTKRRIDATGKIVCPGLIDIHTHVYEWVTNFGVDADDAGVGVGATTIVDQGSAGAWTFAAFEHSIEKAATDVRAFIAPTVAGALLGGCRGEIIQGPPLMLIDEMMQVIEKRRHIVRGIKVHAESGSFSQWGTKVLEAACAASAVAGIPVYTHTGELYGVNEDTRPEPRSVVEAILPFLKPGDILAHVCSGKPDGIVDGEVEVPAVIYRALDKGLHFDVGYGLNFRNRIARLLTDAKVYPYLIGSDVHGPLNGFLHKFHDYSMLHYSLPGAMSRMWALGMPLMEVLRAVTVNPASVIGEQDELGTLAVGTIADITILEVRRESWKFADGIGDVLGVEDRLIPHLTLRAGVRHSPHERMLRDVLDPECFNLRNDRFFNAE
jgi:dihydroorotase